MEVQVNKEEEQGERGKQKGDESRQEQQVKK